MQHKSWGVPFHHGMYHAIDHECFCGEKLPFRMWFRIPLLAGFSTECPLREDKVGCGIFECQACHEYFWFHFSEETVGFFRANASQWPK